MRHVDRSHDRLDVSQGAQGDTISVIVQDLDSEDVVGKPAAVGIGLNINPPGLAEPVEVIDVIPSQVDLEGLEDRGDRHVEIAGLAPVELVPKLGHADREGGEESR